MTNLTLCGCGWLGQHLVRRLPSEYQVLGTTRSADNAARLSQLQVLPHCYLLGDDPQALSRTNGASPVILNIPPGARKKPLDPAFVDNMKTLIDAFFAAGSTYLIFISTTAVYGDQNSTITEQTARQPVTASGSAHVEIEDYLQQHYANKSVVIRLAGLIGADRHPIHFLSGRSLDKGEQVVNLVHEADVCQAILSLLKTPITGAALHLCALKHPKRGHFYNTSAQKKGLEAPVFNFDFDTLPASGKRIDAQHSWKQLGVAPIYADPYDML
ncbi:NAD-dependent epimerase/dehydratase family protein [Salinimonas marina]|uniref:NAD-dependent epimerase/dehydratase family protein n=1 Tax=Salinimonas marina TaxID=2785918 RepID=A0A7S9HDZ0_9ALTE|nr:NAD-dependent epimerase/dehydratase family protein [Salinimonas marina]QPG06091.1 NAD-dependent epimerase/dehydratase family protein [Salinimonas marina]